MKLRIIAIGPGHYRAGRRHPPTSVDHPAGTFTAEQIDALQADPRLKVEELEEVVELAPEPAPETVTELAPEPAPETVTELAPEPAPETVDAPIRKAKAKN